ncbi:MAG: hypothetical protein ACKOWF_16960 [Chloroflexota bacterium]
MEFAPLESDGGAGSNGHGHAHDHVMDLEWMEALTRSVAHMAAQLTVAQLRLRALATHLEARGAADPEAVAAHLALLAERDGGALLRENLGPALAEVIDVDDLERQLIAQLGGPAI